MKILQEKITPAIINIDDDEFKKLLNPKISSNKLKLIEEINEIYLKLKSIQRDEKMIIFSLGKMLLAAKRLISEKKMPEMVCFNDFLKQFLINNFTTANKYIAFYKFVKNFPALLRVDLPYSLILKNKTLIESFIKNKLVQ